jgi:hypothetical protein
MPDSIHGHDDLSGWEQHFDAAHAELADFLRPPCPHDAYRDQYAAARAAFACLEGFMRLRAEREDAARRLQRPTMEDMVNELLAEVA